ncbi:MAG: Dabb family protein [Planctomycetota bacterium]
MPRRPLTRPLTRPLPALLAVPALLALTALPSCTAPSAGARPGEVEHVVLVWLKDGASATVRDAILAAARAFPDRIPGFVSLSTGTALASDRDVVDDSFDLGLVMRFRDAAALHAYETHPVHEAALRDLLLPNAARVQVYDVLGR